MNRTFLNFCISLGTPLTEKGWTYTPYRAHCMATLLFLAHPVACCNKRHDTLLVSLWCRGDCLPSWRKRRAGTPTNCPWQQRRGPLARPAALFLLVVDVDVHPVDLWRCRCFHKDVTRLLYS